MAQILSLALAIFTFAGSVGVGVFTHFCHDDGVEQSFIIPQANACADDHEEIETCCATVKKVETEIAESSCCSNEIDFFQVAFETFESSDVFIFSPVEFLEVQPSIFTFETTSTEVSFANYANPPPLRTGRQILIQHQVFRI